MNTFVTVTRSHAVALWTAAVLAVVSPVAGQEAPGGAISGGGLYPVAPATIARDGAGHVTVRATRIDAALTLDGQLDEGVYGQIKPIDGFIQQEPREGQPATQKTDVWLLYDGANIYVSARCWTTEPERIVANEMRRDGFAIFQNDNFGVLFDTFHDRRNGFFFYTNPLGALADQTITDERDSNRDWNTVWDVRAARFDQGWTVEMAIPFRSLRYAGPGDQVWGVQFRRVVRKTNEASFLTPMSAAFTRSAMNKVSQAGTLVGLEAPPAALNLELKPSVVAAVETDLSATTPHRNDPSASAALDAKYTLKNGLVADVTVNTDFAQVEDDEQQVNLTRFGQFFPERREFFLEGAGIFAFGGASVSPHGGPGGGGPSSNTPILFYSRRIGLYESDEATGSVPILAGGRLTGRTGAFTVGALNIQQRKSTELGAPATNFSAVRLKRDFLKQGNIGLLFTNRSVAIDSPGAAQTIGADAGFTFFRNLTLDGYYAMTRTDGRHGDDASYRARAEYQGDRYGLQAEHLTVEKNFNPETGFLRREDFHRNYGKVRFSPRPATSKTIRKYQFEVNFDHFTSTAGRLESQELQAMTGLDLQNGDEFRVELRNSYEYLTDPFEINTGIVLPVGGYRFNEVEARYDMGPQRRISGNFSVGRGQFYNGTRTQAGYRGRLELTPKIGIEPGVALNWVDLVEGSFLSKLLTARVNYSLSPRSAFSALVQYNSKSNAVGANLRYRWEFRPGSDLFVVFNEGRDSTLGVRHSELSNRTFAIKVTRLFRF